MRTRRLSVLLGSSVPSKDSLPTLDQAVDSEFETPASVHTGTDAESDESSKEADLHRRLPSSDVPVQIESGASKL